MNQYLEKALRSLTVTSNKSAQHPTDEARVKQYLRVLHKNGIGLDADEIQGWLRANGWQEGPVKQVANWAKHIAEGGRVQVRKFGGSSDAEVWKRLQQPE